jgi:hypothetical protein
MTSQTINPIILSEQFWLEAIDPSSAFAEEGRTEFRRGLSTGDVDDLAWSRLILHSLRDQAMWPIVIRLMDLAALTPRAEFVEALSLFLTSQRTVERLSVQSSDLTDEELHHALLAVNGLKEILSRAGAMYARDLDALIGSINDSIQRRQ